MKVTKLGHCCLLIEEKGVRILTDPGAWTQEQNDLQNIDVLLITHEHQDHFHIASVKQILGNNPEVKIFCNQSVGKLLAEQEVKFELLGHGQSTVFKDISLEGMGRDHARIYEQYGQVENTGYFIANRLFYPGDSFFNPQKYVEILALPVAGPWMKISEAIDYAKAVHPKVCFPVHDGYLKIRGFIYNLVKNFVEPYDIKFIDTDENNSFEIQ